MALTVSVRVKHPLAHSVAHPWTNNSVLGLQPHGTAMVVRTWQVGTGQRRAAQSAGLVVRVMVGHGVLVVAGGSTTTLVMTRVCCVVVGRTVVVVVGGICRRVLLVVLAHVRDVVRNSIPQPWYGHEASQGTASVAVGIEAGQPQGLRSVVVKLQSVKGHSTPHARFWTVRVAVGQDCAWATQTPTRPARRVPAARSFMVGAALEGLSGARWRDISWRQGSEEVSTVFDGRFGLDQVA